MSEPAIKKRIPVKRVDLLEDGWPKHGLLRCNQIIEPHGILPLSKSQFWVLVKERQIPVVKLSPRVSAFWVHDLRRAFFTNATDANDSPVRNFEKPALDAELSGIRTDGALDA